MNAERAAITVRRLRLLVVLLLLWACLSDVGAGCVKVRMARLGTELGRTFVELAKVLAQLEFAEIADDYCDRGGLNATQARVCKLERKVDKLFARLMRASRRSCYDPKGPYHEQYEFYTFRVLQEALRAAQNPRERAHLLAYMNGLCWDPTALSYTGGRACREEIEEAFVWILENDNHPFNRHFALELLAIDYRPTERSRKILEEIAATARDSEGPCPPIRGTSAQAMDPVWHGYAEGKYRCERRLALQALAQLGSPREKGGSGN